MKKNILKIGFDLDGVIIDHTLNKIRLAGERGYFLKNNQTDSESMKKIIPSDVYLKIQKNIYGKEGLSSRPMMNAKKVLKKIIKLFPNVCIISRRGIKINETKFGFQWLRNNNLQHIFDKKNVFFVSTDGEKNILCKQMGIDVYIDDKITILKRLFSVKNRILFDKNNYYKSFQKNIIVVRDWEELYSCLQRLHNVIV